MTWFLDEIVTVRPKSMAFLETVGEVALELIEPNRLATPGVLDYAKCADFTMPAEGIHLRPVERDDPELGGYNEAVTVVSAVPLDHPIDILMIEERYDELFEGGSIAHRARATYLHELAHAILHVRQLRHLLVGYQTNPTMVLARSQRGNVPAFRDPEWQAWALAGAIAAPRKMIAACPGCDCDELAEIFGVSSSFMRSHLRRLKLKR